MLAKSLSAGFTMIELMIGLVILAILLSLGMPAFTGILESSRTKAAASGFSMGLQRARAEAISRNTPVTFTPSGAGWTMSAGGADFDTKDGGESSGGSVTVTPNTAVVIIELALKQCVVSYIYLLDHLPSKGILH